MIPFLFFNQLPSIPSKVSVTATGHGMALVDVSQHCLCQQSLSLSVIHGRLASAFELICVFACTYDVNM